MMTDPQPTPPTQAALAPPPPMPPRVAPADTAPRPSPLLRAMECGLIFGLGPALVDLRDFNRLLIPLLVTFALVCLLVLRLDPSFDRRRLWNGRRAIADLPRVIGVFVLGAGAIAVFTYFHDPDRILAFARQAPAMFAAVMILYPFFSVYPQELVFRAFFFHRYACVFRHPVALIGASGLAFGWAHVVLENWIAVGLSTIGGLLFAWTYHRTRSTLAASIEHALYGDFIWTIGLGVYFYAGSIQ